MMAAGRGIHDLDEQGLLSNRYGGEKRPFKPEQQQKTDDFDQRQRRRMDEHWDDTDGHYIIQVGESLLPQYKIMKIIGEGTFGKVTQCWDRKEKKYVAIKIIKSIQKYRDAARVEIEILRDIQHRDVSHERFPFQITAGNLVCRD
jgi:serine/threonine protein kinase